MFKKRFQTFMGVLGIGAPNYYPYWLPAPAVVYTDSTFNAAFKRRAFRLALRNRRLLIFRGWFYGLTILALVVVGLRLGLTEPVVFWSLAASGAGYQLAYFIVAPDSYFRFSWWTMCAALLQPACVRWSDARRLWDRRRRLSRSLSRAGGP
jgi:hypothetical protein